MLPQKKHALADLEKTNDQASNDVEEWRNLESDIKQADVDWLGAKEKLAFANSPFLSHLLDQQPCLWVKDREHETELVLVRFAFNGDKNKEALAMVSIGWKKR
ncbi:hypothetical protein GH714_006765 [Hevea brasiliensis]|uniref:Uncharacterized protein n=1 Tax=Hevea brasiliensis TaxID=3981 RepID=A0A6A6LIB8_HEVBR|nr:hypothetical protein GH714_006765 [Hevea brasiliensis]